MRWMSLTFPFCMRDVMKLLLYCGEAVTHEYTQTGIHLYQIVTQTHIFTKLSGFT